MEHVRAVSVAVTTAHDTPPIATMFASSDPVLSKPDPDNVSTVPEVWEPGGEIRVHKVSMCNR